MKCVETGQDCTTAPCKSCPRAKPRSATAPPLTVQEFEQDFPDDELIVYRNDVLDLECLIAIPKRKLTERAKEGKEPYWRHGQTMHVKRPEDSVG